MGDLARVFLAASVGTILGAFAEPYIVQRLPANLQSPNVGKAVHATIAATSTVAVYWAIRSTVK